MEFYGIELNAHAIAWGRGQRHSSGLIIVHLKQ